MKVKELVSNKFTTIRVNPNSESEVEQEFCNIYDIVISLEKTDIYLNKSFVINLEVKEAINEFNTISDFAKKLKKLSNIISTEETLVQLLQITDRSYKTYMDSKPKIFNIFDIIKEVYECHMKCSFNRWDPCSLTKLHKWIIKFYFLKPRDLFGSNCKSKNVSCALKLNVLDSTICDLNDYDKDDKDDNNGEKVYLVYTFEIKPEVDSLPSIQLSIPYSISKHDINLVRPHLIKRE